MPEDESINSQDDGLEPKLPEPLSKNQKIQIGSLAVFAFLIIVLWFAQLRNNIYGPFNAPSGSSQLALSDEATQAAKDEALKTKDTDSDGLNDYDELNVYKTSPYLEDSDSDGFKDGEEIAKGFDPNCPQGRTCAETNLLEDNAAAANGTLDSLLNQYGATDPSAQPGGSTDLNSGQLEALKNIDAASLRALLLEQGMDKATLDKISDADLLKSFQETLNE